VYRGKKMMTNPKVLTSIECKKPIRFFLWLLVVVCVVTIIYTYYSEIHGWWDQKLYVLQRGLISLGMKR